MGWYQIFVTNPLGREEGEGRKEEGQSKREKRGGKEGGRRETVHSKMIVEDGGE